MIINGIKYTYAIGFVYIAKPILAPTKNEYNGVG
jgi:hypothetical protein